MHCSPCSRQWKRADSDRCDVKAGGCGRRGFSGPLQQPAPVPITATPHASSSSGWGSWAEAARSIGASGASIPQASPGSTPDNRDGPGPHTAARPRSMGWGDSNQPSPARASKGPPAGGAVRAIDAGSPARIEPWTPPAATAGGKPTTAPTADNQPAAGAIAPSSPPAPPPPPPLRRNCRGGSAPSPRAAGWRGIGRTSDPYCRRRRCHRTSSR